MASASEGVAGRACMRALYCGARGPAPPQEDAKFSNTPDKQRCTIEKSHGTGFGSPTHTSSAGQTAVFTTAYISRCISRSNHGPHGPGERPRRAGKLSSSGALGMERVDPHGCRFPVLSVDCRRRFDDFFGEASSGGRLAQPPLCPNVPESRDSLYSRSHRVRVSIQFAYTKAAWSIAAYRDM